MSGITLTAATRQNLLSLQGTADLLTTTQNRLSTGKKVNSALDDPTSFFTSQALSGRSGDLGQLLNGISNGVQTIQAANQGITSIQKLVDSAKSTANQALADKSTSSGGSAATVATLTAGTSYQGTSTANKAGGVATGTQDFSTGGDASFDLSLDGGTTSAHIQLDKSTLGNVSSDLTNVKAQDVVTVINNQISNNTSLKGKLTASVGADGRINLATTASGANSKVGVKYSAGSTNDIGFGKDTSAVAAHATAGAALAATLDLTGTARTVTAGAALGATTTLGAAGTLDASFKVTDENGKETTVTINKDTISAGSTALGTSAARADVLLAIQKQLSEGNSAVTASLGGANSDTLVFSSTAKGSGSGAIKVDNIASNGAPNLGFGTAAALDTGTKGGALDAAASFTINDGTTTKTIKITADTLYDGTNKLGLSASKDNVLAAIKKQISDQGIAATATLTSAGKLEIGSTNFGADSPAGFLVTNVASVNSVNLGFGTTAAAQATTVGSGTAATSYTASIGSDAVNGGAVNTTRQSLAKQFNDLREQITQLAKDASYNGINLLYRSGTDPAENSLKVTFNETGSSSLSIAGTKIDADGLGLNSVTGDFQSDDEINKALTSITSATSQLRAQASTFGSNLSVVQNRQDFSKNLINILDTGSANLTNADLNEEAANSQALSTRQSIGISALSLANTAQQGILQLLR